jgi:PAS domain S-box-containing protein
VALRLSHGTIEESAGGRVSGRLAPLRAMAARHDRPVPRDAEASLALVSGLLELGVDAFLALDGDLGVRYANDRARAVGLVAIDESGAASLDPALRGELQRRLAGRETTGRFTWAVGPRALRYEVTAASRGAVLSLHFRDVTVEHRAIDELVRSELRYRGLAESTFDIVALFRLDGTLVDINARSEALSGYSRDELVGSRAAFELLTPEMRERASAAAREALRQPREPARYELVLPDKGGAEHHLEVICRAVREEGRPPLLQLVGHDVTESRRLAERLQQAEKLEAVGRLAGGVAHDFNNVLVVVREASALLRKLVDDPDELALIDEIRAEGERGTALVRHLLAFARREPVELEIVDLNEVVRSAQTMLHRLVGGAIDLQVWLEPEPTTVLGDTSQLERVLVNLVLNAREAIDDSGEIRVETGVRLVEAGSRPALGECAPGDYVTLTVRDTGGGIPLELRPRVFEPFFSSRGDENSGLGLAIVYGVVTQLGGGIDLAGGPGQGTTVTVYLPRLTADA